MLRAEKPFTSGKSLCRSVRQPGQDGSTPTFLLLAFRKLPTDLPIEHEHAGIARHRGAHLRYADTLLDVGQQPGDVIPAGAGEIGLFFVMGLLIRRASD